MGESWNGRKFERLYQGEAGVIRDDAFHGTTLQNALKIKDQGFLPRLGIAGVGSYFDLGSDLSAKAFALERADGDPKQGVVIRAELHMGATLNISFRRNPELMHQFRQFQTTLKQQSETPYRLTFNYEKERFLQERYPNVNAVLYFNERTGIWYVAMRDSRRIHIVSMTTLTKREIL